jgi:hypothetical protein
VAIIQTAIFHRTRQATAVFQGTLIEYFTAPDPTYVDVTFRRFVDEFLLAPFSLVDHEPASEPESR